MMADQPDENIIIGVIGATEEDEAKNNLLLGDDASVQVHSNANVELN